ncbi:MAG: RNA polymerase sigma-I factor [bacterium]|nr:RNA polymerase sigma-I factor [bacterium]
MARAREGDPEARNTLISWYQPFVLRVAGAVCRRYLAPGRDDEFSVGLAAFNEAIDGYDESRGVSFLAFAETVIRRRVIDHYRKDRAGKREIPLSALAPEGTAVTDRAGTGEAIQAHRAEAETWERREEVMFYRELLREYGLSLAELARVCPRHEDARRRSLAAARILAEDPALAAFVRTRRALPLRALTARSGLSRKTLERQRKYILGLALVLMEELPYLKSYLTRE